MESVNQAWSDLIAQLWIATDERNDNDQIMFNHAVSTINDAVNQFKTYHLDK